MRRAWMLVLLAGCATGGGEDEGEYAGELTAAQAARVLDLVNYPTTDHALLDGPAKLDSRAADAIASHRAGPDGVYPSYDDDPFESIAELDALPYVGTSALGKLAQYAQANPVPAAQTIEGVRFEGWEAEITVWGANTVPVGVLNGMLDNRAASNIVSHRPLADLAAVADIPLVGSDALRRFRHQADLWWQARALYDEE